MASRIEDYALIGDCETAALVDRTGSVDWLCWPRFDSDACFAALLGEPKHGRWSIAPRSQARISRRYRDNTLILETRFETAEGAVTLVDFMPPRSRQSDLVRLVVGERGRVPMAMELIVRFGYGAIVPWVVRTEDSAWRAIAGPDMVALRTPVRLIGRDLTTIAEFTVAEGEMVPFVLGYAPSNGPLPPALDATAALQATESFWREWAKSCPPRGRMVGAGHALADHAQSAHLCAHRRNRRRADHLIAGNDRRTAQLGLSFLLGARCEPDAVCPHGRRLSERSAGIARVAPARCRGEPGSDSDHVWHRRRAPPHRMGSAVTARL
jgi:GH15 family glucan-1,4-alpha-glucosidase